MSPVVWIRRIAVMVVVALGSALLSAPARAEERPVVGADAPGAVPGSYIVVFKPGARKVGKVAASARAMAGDGVEEVFQRSISGFSARLSERQARRLAADPAVDFVEQDRVMRATDTQIRPPWGVDRIDERSLPLSGTYRPTSTASAVRAYIIDTGIRISHRDFGGRASYGWDAVDNDSYAHDCDGHGTHVAGTVGGYRYGVAKRVRLVAVRVLNCYGWGYTSDVIDGIDWVTENAIRPAVANLSLGGPSSPALDNAVQASIASGITYAVAAGNGDANACYGSPARVAAAITVGATDSRDRRASFSNYGGCLDLFAPGVKITSASWRSYTGAETFSGTSMAAPHVAGAVAMILAAAPRATPAAVRSLLVRRATVGRIVDKGSASSPNRLLFTTCPAPCNG